MTAQEYNDNLTSLYGLVSGNLAGDTLVVAGQRMLTAIKQRVLDGKNTGNSEIGKYSTKPIYASEKIFIAGGFSGQGKRGNIGDRLVPSVRLKTTSVKRNPTKYKKYSLVNNKTGRPRTSMYLANGYKQLREVQSLQSAHIDFSYSGAMLAAYQQELEGQTVIQGFTQDLQSKKRKGLEARFGNTFYPTDQEKQNYIDEVTFLINRLTVNTIEGFHVEAIIT